MTRQRLPIGIQNFRRLRETGSYYVDKTPLIRQLIEQGDHYFLSRPRRFGKSLLLDTLGSLFACHKSLFEGLDIYPHWDWSAPHPVVRLSFGGKYNEPGEIEGDIIEQLEAVERGRDLAPAPTSDTGPRRLRNLLDRLHDTAGRPAVVLVDEYDKPILDVLHDPDLARANRDYLRGFYGIIKDSAEHVRFVFVTGVSMFAAGSRSTIPTMCSKVSLFSGLNNLKEVFVLEFKMAEDEDGAITRCGAGTDARAGLSDQYADHDGPVHLVGVACGRDVRNLLDIRAEPA